MFSQLTILPTLAKFPSLRRIDVLSENMHPWTIPHMLAKLSLVRQWYISGVKVKGVSALREVRQGPIESLALVNVQGKAWDLYDTLAHTLRDCPLHNFKTVFAIGRVPTLTFNRLLSMIGPRLQRMALVFSSHVASEEYHGHGPRGGIDWENAIFDTYDELQFGGLHEIRRLVVSLTCNGENLMHILCQLLRPDRLTHLTILLPLRDLLQCSPFLYAEKTDLQLIDDLLSDKYTALKECRIIKASHDEYNMEDLYEDAKAGFPKTLAAGKLHLLWSVPGKGVEDLDDGFLWD
ncbi:hypothetical protein K474DRAFT_1723197 [Panus rudis PR-1116 ss-1]|nr:hypothetical protein K474DRAFT_1723197 [Panus rudis PR-1116 ss-1]